jgi:hypothetical protein
MILSPEALRRAWENAEKAPPFSPAIRDQLRLILWGSAAMSESETSAESSEAA